MIVLLKRTHSLAFILRLHIHRIPSIILRLHVDIHRHLPVRIAHCILSCEAALAVETDAAGGGGRAADGDDVASVAGIVRVSVGELVGGGVVACAVLEAT